MTPAERIDKAVDAGFDVITAQGPLLVELEEELRARFPDFVALLRLRASDGEVFCALAGDLVYLVPWWATLSRTARSHRVRGAACAWPYWDIPRGCEVEGWEASRDHFKRCRWTPAELEASGVVIP